MGFNNKWFRAEAQPVTGAPAEKLTEDQFACIRTNMKNLFQGLGYDLPSEPNMFCHSGTDLRIFQMEEDGSLKAIPPWERVYSEAFIEKVQCGQVFVFPAGDEEPVQMQIERDKSSRICKLRLSKPFEGNPVRKPVENPPKPLNGWQSFWNRFSGGRFYKAEKAEYLSKKQEYDEKMKPWFEGDKKLTALKQARKTYREQELGDYQAEAARREREKEERAKQDLADLRAADMEKDFLNGTQIGKNLDRMQAVYGSNSLPEDDIIANQTYTLEQHRQLVPYDLSKVQPEKFAVDERGFMALGILAAGTDEIAGNMRLDQPGMSELTAAERINVTLCNVSTDLAEEGGMGRANTGNFFPQIQQARGKAYQALEAYKNNDPKPLAELIAKGIHQGVENVEHRGLSYKMNLTAQLMYGGGLALLEQDGKLMEAAKEAGLTDEDIYAAKSCVEKAKLVCRKERAEKLLNADAKKTLDPPLTKEERRAFLDDVLRYQVVDQSIERYLESAKRSQAYQENIQARLNQREEFDAQKAAVISRMSRKELEPQEAKRQSKELDDKIRAEITVMQGKLGRTLGVPKVQQLLAIDPRKAVDGLLDLTLRHRDKLLELPPEKLMGELNDRKLFAKDSPYATTAQERQELLSGGVQPQRSQANGRTEPEQKSAEADSAEAGDEEKYEALP